MKVKIIEPTIFADDPIEDLENKINNYIANRDGIIDIKYCASNGGTYSHMYYGAMIITK